MSEVASAVKIQSIHHFAYKCRNAQETRRFYEEVLGLPLVVVLEEEDVVTTTGERMSFAHFFFQMEDGNYIAFFDFGDGVAPVLDAATPRFANHLAFRVEDEAALMSAKSRLENNGIHVDGPLEHEFVRSIYFWDPNGIRLEYAYTLFGTEQMQAERDKAAARLARWSARVAERRQLAERESKD